MRNIKDLFENANKVYFYLEGDDTKERFVSDAHSAGFVFADGTSLENLKPEKFMSATKDGNVYYIGVGGSMYMKSSKTTDGIGKVDYKKFISGADDYSYRA